MLVEILEEHVGNKSPLATGIDYYIVETCYNGMKMIAHCYNHKTDMVIGKFNAASEENPLYTFIDKAGNEISWYYEKTTEKNGTKVSIPAKRINRDKFVQAVKSQLLYFSQIRFIVVNEDGYKEDVNFKAKVLHNSRNIVISDNSYYSKPHILIVKDFDSSEAISYGYVDFREMEMEELFSSIGIKATIRSTMRDEKTGEEILLQEGISVVPSRESIIWDDHTRNYIINKFKEVQEEASDIVTESLKEEDILLWIEAANNALNNSGSNPILHRLSKVIDKTSISPIFNNTKIRFSSNPSNFFDGFEIRKITKTKDWNTGKLKLERESATLWPHSTDCIYYKTGDTVREKDFYLLATSVGTNDFNKAFFTITPIELDKFLEGIKIPDFKKTLSPEETEALKNKYEKEKVDKRELLVKYLQESKRFKVYEDVEVPEDWRKKFEEDENFEVEAVKKAKQASPAELRKLEEKTVCYTLKDFEYARNDKPRYEWKKREPKIGDLVTTQNIYYGLGEEELEIKKAFAIVNVSAVESKPIFYKVATGNKKHFKAQKSINSFFKKITSDNIITMAPELINWYTAKLIHKKRYKFSFLSNYRIFNEDMFNAYSLLTQFEDTYYSAYLGKTNEFKNIEVEKDLSEMCDKVLELELYSKDHTEEEVKIKSAEIFTVEYKSGKAVINEYYDLLLKVEEYCESIYPLFNEVTFLISQIANITPEQEHLVKEIIEAKHLQDYKIDSVLLNPVVISVEDESEPEQQPVAEHFIEE